MCLQQLRLTTDGTKLQPHTKRTTMPPAPKATAMPSAEAFVETKAPLIIGTIEEAIQDGRATVSFSGNEKGTTTTTIHTNGGMDSEYTNTKINEQHWKRGLNIGHELKCEVGICHPEAPKSAPMPKYDTATEISEQVPCTNNEGNSAGCDGSGGGIHPRSLGLKTVIDAVAKPHFAAQPFVILFGICFGLLMLFFMGKKLKKSLEGGKRRREATFLPRFETQIVQGGVIREIDDSVDESQLNSLNLVVVGFD
ncbi:hypothetical protein BDZ45DRAFT_776789 [Acephala macrosclerotiorum]|nr:hypothetical protein BDZ45DRAFT_776789 [Acephala macrosclerotiorum]